MDHAPQAYTSFSYRAQTLDGRPFSGTMDAPTAAVAAQQLQILGLRVIELGAAPAPPAPRPLSRDDFLAFNQQLASLTAAGLPLEHGLRLVGQDMQRGRLARTIQQIAGELESGKPLARVFEQHRGQFPSSYAALLDAGVKSGNLPGMLYSLAKHMELERRLKGMLWRTFSYPLMVLVGLGLVLIFIAVWIVPRFASVLGSFKVQLPVVTQVVIAMAWVVPPVVGTLIVLVLLWPAIWWMLRRMKLDGVVLDRVAASLPLIGPVLRKNLLATWCDAMRMGVEAGLDLPSAIGLAAQASASPALAQESEAMARWISAGHELSDLPRGWLIPPSVAAAMSLGMKQGDLASTLRSLAQMYQQQAESRLAALPGILTPILLLLIAILIGTVISALIMPVVNVIRAVSGA